MCRIYLREVAWQDDRTNRFLTPNNPPLTISLRKFYYQACDIINGLRRVFFPQLSCRHAKVLTGSFRAPAEKTILVTMLYYIFLDRSNTSHRPSEATMMNSSPSSKQLQSISGILLTPACWWAKESPRDRVIARPTMCLPLSVVL